MSTRCHHYGWASVKRPFLPAAPCSSRGRPENWKIVLKHVPRYSPEHAPPNGCRCHPTPVLPGCRVYSGKPYRAHQLASPGGLTPKVHEGGGSALCRVVWPSCESFRDFGQRLMARKFRVEYNAGYPPQPASSSFPESLPCCLNSSTGNCTLPRDALHYVASSYINCCCTGLGFSAQNLRIESSELLSIF